MLKKRPCKICRKWFYPHPRVGDRQRTCSSPACQKKRQQKNVADWHRLHPDYAVKHRMRKRELKQKRGESVDPLELPSPLEQLPWEEAQKQFGTQGADFIGHFGRLLLESAKKQMRTQLVEINSKFETHPARLE
jgi:hypothetical protein